MFYEQGSILHSVFYKPVKKKLRYYSPLFFDGRLCHGLISSLLSSSNRWAVSRFLCRQTYQATYLLHTIIY